MNYMFANAKIEYLVTVLHSILNAAFDDNISDALFRRQLQEAFLSSFKEVSENV